VYAHLIDVTESYLDRFALARAGTEAPPALGLPGMAQKLDEGALRFRSLSDDAAITLIPFMLIVTQYTVDAARANDLKCKFGIQISGPGGGSWCVSVDGTAVSYEEGSTEGCQTVFDFDPNDFVLSTYQRTRGGTSSGDQALAERVRDLLFKI
jgi:hypothetical protein